MLPSETLAELEKIKVFTQKPTADSMTKALYAAGKLVVDKDGKHLQVRKSVNGHQLRGWLLKPPEDKTTKTKEATPEQPGGLAKNDMHRPQQPTKTTKTTEKAKKRFPGENGDRPISEKSNKKSGGLGGLSGLDKAIDNGSDKTTGKTTPRPVEETKVECHLQHVRIAARMEYDVNGAVDPGVLAANLNLDKNKVVISLSMLGYEPVQRFDGSVVFKQKVYTSKEARA